MLAASRLRGLKRGAAPFVPTDIAGLTPWWDFSDATTLFEDTARTDPVDISGDFIRGVTDKSGGGIHLSEATNPPQYITGAQNGKSGSRYDGVNDMLRAALTLAQPMTIFIVGDHGGTGDRHFIDGDASANRVLVGRSGPGNWVVYAGSIFSAGAADTNPHIFAFVVNGASSNLRIGGGAGTSGDAGTQGFNAQIDLAHSSAGGDVYNACDIYEVLIYNSSLSVANLNLVGNYLESKWNLTWTDA